jgi:cell division protein FtsA
MNTLTAIELGSDKVACAIATLDDNPQPKIRILGFASSKSRGIKRAQVIDIQEATKSLEECLSQAERMAGTRVNSAILVTSGPNISAQTSHGIVAVTYQNQDITEEDVGRVIESAKAISLGGNREIIHVLPQQFIVDGQSNIKNPVGMAGIRLEVDTHIISASAINLNNIRKVCNLLGVQVDSFVFSGLASSESVLTETEKELGCVLVDIGGGTSDITIFADNSVVHSAVIPLGSKNVTSDIAAGLRVSLPSADKIKLFLSSGDKNKPESGSVRIAKKTDEIKIHRDELDITSLNLNEEVESVSKKVLVDGIIRPRLEEIADYIDKEINNAGLKDQVPSGVIITGGGALTPYIVKTLRSSLNLSIRVGFPKELEGIADELKEPNYAALVGALLYSNNYVHTTKPSSIPDISQMFKKIEVKESLQKTLDFFKSFIPGAK